MRITDSRIVKVSHATEDTIHNICCATPISVGQVYMQFVMVTGPFLGDMATPVSGGVCIADIHYWGSAFQSYHLTNTSVWRRMNTPI